MGADAVVKYADKLAELGDDVIIVRHKNNLDVVDDFKGFNLNNSEIFFKNADEVWVYSDTNSPYGGMN